MPIQWTTNAQKTWPPAADGISLTPSGSAWTSGNYVTVEAAAATDAVLSGVIVRSTSVTNHLQFEIDIATGSAASEVVIATIRGYHEGGGSSTDVVNVRWPLMIPVDAISAGDRVSARVRVNDTSTTAWIVSLEYFEKPITGNMDVSATPPKIQPPAAAMPAISFSSGWAYGAWTQLIASTATAIVIDGFVFYLSATEGEIQIATGGAGNEAVVTTLYINGANIGGYKQLALPNPLDNIAASTRIAARGRNGAGGVCGVVYSYREKPL